MLDRRNFGKLLAATALSSLAAPAIIVRPSFAQSQGPRVARGNYLIKNGTIITVDPALGTLPRADLQVNDGRIEAIGSNLTASGAEIIDAEDMIVMPGFIETHHHMWSSIGRNFVGDAGFGYFPAKNATSKLYNPIDFYRSVTLGLVECANAGITTVHNWSHNTRTPEHADGELQAHNECMLRARYSYGHVDQMPRNEPLSFADIDRVKSAHFATGTAFDGLLTFGVNLRGLSQSNEAAYFEDMKQARDRKLKVAIHAGQSGPNTLIAKDYEQKGWLGPDLLICHYIPASDEDAAIMARTRTPLSYSTLSEMRLSRTGDARAALMRMRKAGVLISLSFDATSIAPLNMFETMRVTWNMGMPWKGTPTENDKEMSFQEAIEMGTINGAKALGLGDITGSLTVGKRADIVLIRGNDINIAPVANAVTAVVQAASPANVDTVMVDGRIVKRGGRLVAYDIDRIVREGKESAMRIRQTAGGRLAPPSVTW